MGNRQNLRFNRWGWKARDLMKLPARMARISERIVIPKETHILVGWTSKIVSFLKVINNKNVDI
jgi:hypothetical protein